VRSAFKEIRQFLVGDDEFSVFREERLEVNTSILQVTAIARPASPAGAGAGTDVDGTGDPSIGTSNPSPSSSSASSVHALTPPAISEFVGSSPPVLSLDGADRRRLNTAPRHYIKYLPLCFAFSSCARLTHIEVRMIDDSHEDDEVIFNRMRAAYNRRKGWLRRTFSCYRLRKLQPVKVLL